MPALADSASTYSPNGKSVAELAQHGGAQRIAAIGNKSVMIVAETQFSLGGAHAVGDVARVSAPHSTMLLKSGVLSLKRYSFGYLSSMQYYFQPVRELPTGRGFADFVYLPKPEYRTSYPALLVELKWNKSTDTAIEQIWDKKYPDSILEYTGNILLVGKALCTELPRDEWGFTGKIITDGVGPGGSYYMLPDYAIIEHIVKLVGFSKGTHGSSFC